MSTPTLALILARADRPCTGAALDDFFAREHETRTGAAARMAPVARALCGACPLRAACLDFARERREVGVWGGVLRIMGGNSTMSEIDLLGPLPTPRTAPGRPRRPPCTEPGHTRSALSDGRVRCLTCRLEAARARSGAKPRPPLQPCGTRAAWRRHRARGEQPCQPCADARRGEQDEANERRRADRAQGGPQVGTKPRPHTASAPPPVDTPRARHADRTATHTHRTPAGAGAASGGSVSVDVPQPNPVPARAGAAPSRKD